MKINELLDNFEIYATNEERRLLDKLHTPTMLETLDEREQLVAQNMITKSLIRCYKKEDHTFVIKNHI
jgi:hypothetical protein